MTFKASKQRKRRQPEPLLEGPALVPSAAIAGQYAAQLRALVQGYMRALAEAATGHHTPGMGDATSLENEFVGRLARVRKKHEKRLNEVAQKAARDFVMRVNTHSKTSIRSTLNALAKEPQFLPPAPELTAQQEAHIEENVALIRDLTEEAYKRVEEVVILSVNTPEKEKQGMKGIYDMLREKEGMSKRRAEFIAQDQTAKVYTSLNTDRMQKAGLSTFKWQHSSAGKVPRPCHVERDGKIFSLAGGPDELLWPDGSDANPDFNAKPGDYGKPGYAPRCRCRMIAAITLDD